MRPSCRTWPRTSGSRCRAPGAAQLHGRCRPARRTLTRGAQLRGRYAAPTASVFQAGWPAAEYALERADEWAALRALRDEVNKGLEEARADKAVGASLEAKLVMHVEEGTPLHAALTRYASGAANEVDELRYIFLTSQVELAATAAEASAAGTLAVRREKELGATIGIAAADGLKCARCWHYSETVAAGGASPAYHGVCGRCAGSLDLMGFPPVGAPAPKAAAEEQDQEAAAEP